VSMVSWNAGLCCRAVATKALHIWHCSFGSPSAKGFRILTTMCALLDLARPTSRAQLQDRQQLVDRRPSVKTGRMKWRGNAELKGSQTYEYEFCNAIAQKLASQDYRSTGYFSLVHHTFDHACSMCLSLTCPCSISFCLVGVVDMSIARSEAASFETARS
jgi:hypothetical protein